MDDEIQKLARKLAAGPPQPSKPLVGKEVLDHGFQHAERNELPKYYTTTHSIFEMTLPGSPEYTVKDAPAMAEWNKLREQIALVLQPYQE